MLYILIGTLFFNIYLEVYLECTQLYGLNILRAFMELLFSNLYVDSLSMVFFKVPQNINM